MVVVIVLAGAMVLLRGWWGWHAERRLRAQFDAYRSIGEPATWEDIASQPESTAPNLAAALQQASGLIAVHPPRYTYGPSQIPPYPPFPVAWVNATAQSESGNQTVFPVVRQARDIPPWFVIQSKSAMGVGGANLWTYSGDELADVLLDGEDYALYSGNSAEAIDRLIDLELIGKAAVGTSDSRWFEVSLYIVSQAIERNLVRRLAQSSD